MSITGQVIPILPVEAHCHLCPLQISIFYPFFFTSYLRWVSASRIYHTDAGLEYIRTDEDKESDGVTIKKYYEIQPKRKTLLSIKRRKRSWYPPPSSEEEELPVKQTFATCEVAGEKVIPQQKSCKPVEITCMHTQGKQSPSSLPGECLLIRIPTC